MERRRVLLGPHEVEFKEEKNESEDVAEEPRGLSISVKLCAECAPIVTLLGENKRAFIGFQVLFSRLNFQLSARLALNLAIALLSPPLGNLRAAFPDPNGLW
jgi:hypothetical protein